MTIYDKIIWFMLGKAAEIKKFCDIEYFTDADAQAIYKMDKEELEVTWRVVKKWIKHNYGGLTAATCPFCIYYKDYEGIVDCNRCGYGENHGLCDENNSDWAIVQRNFETIIPNALTNEFYKNLVDEIEIY